MKNTLALVLMVFGSFPRNFEAHSSTLDCRHEIDVIDEIIEKVKELYISKIDEK